MAGGGGGGRGGRREKEEAGDGRDMGGKGERESNSKEVRRGNEKHWSKWKNCRCGGVVAAAWNNRNNKIRRKSERKN